MRRLDRENYEKIKEDQKAKNTKKRFNFVEGVNKDIPAPM